MSVSIAMETLLYSAALWKCSKVREGAERWEERREGCWQKWESNEKKSSTATVKTEEECFLEIWHQVELEGKCS